jgi:hypothetical protein
MTAPRVDTRRRGVRAIADASRESGAKKGIAPVAEVWIC